MRKKILAVVLCLMTAVAFMPVMAFAASHTFTATSWGSDYSTVTGYLDGDTTDVVTVNADRAYQQNGMIKATPDVSKYPICTVTNNALKEKYYYDLNEVSIKSTSQMAASIFTYDEFEELFTQQSTDPWSRLSGNDLKIGVPSYVSNKSTATAVEMHLVNYYVRMYMPAYDDASYAEQKFEGVAFDLTAKDHEVDGTADGPDVLGAIPAKDFTVRARSGQASEVHFFQDVVKTGTGSTQLTEAREKSNSASDTVEYSGVEHKIVANEVPNTAVSYEKFNSKVGKWEAVDAATYKDAATTLYNYRATVKNTKAGSTETKTVYFNIKVNSAPVKYGLKRGVLYTNEKCDAFDFVKIEPTAATDEDAAAAIKADIEVLNAYVKAKFDVTATPVAHTENHIELVMEQKTLTPAEAEALAETVTNFTITDPTGTDLEAAVELKGGSLHNEIEFTKAVSSKTYHVKKAKGLKATKSFTVKAEALSGVAPSYKLINANSKIKIDQTGKITLEKGLKKGTYKIKVKAYGAAGNGYDFASETQAIKIVIKK